MPQLMDLIQDHSCAQVTAIRSGIEAIEADNLANNCGLARIEMANLLNLTPHKFQHQISRNLRLDSVASERLLRLARVANHAAGIFGDTTSAGRWLMNPHSALNQATPLSMLDTSYGEQEIGRILCSIQYGLPA